MQKGFCTRLAACALAAATFFPLSATAADDVLPAGNGWTMTEVPVQVKPSYKFRGRLFADQIWMDDLAGPGGATFAEDNFTGFRTARLGVEGNIFENLKYCLEVDFTGNDAKYKDVYAEYENMPWLGTAKVGHYKEPFGLEELTSSRFITFMERATPSAMFAPSRNFGVTFGDGVGAADDFSWWVGLFRGGFHDNEPARGADGVAGSGDSNDWAVTGRFVWLPYYDEATPGRCLLHTGFGYTMRRVGIDPDQSGNGKFEGFLELDSRDGPINTYLPIDTEFHIVNTEVAWIRGPLCVANEFYFGHSNTGASPWGTYIQASYFLTGENRGYKKSSKAFDRVKVFEPVFAVRTTEGVVRGWGAWELAARWDYLDASGIGFQPNTTLGNENNFTFGVNWYLNSYNRVMFNYVHTNSDVTDTGGVAGVVLGNYTGDHVGVRYQIDW